MTTHSPVGRFYAPTDPFQADGSVSASLTGPVSYPTLPGVDGATTEALANHLILVPDYRTFAAVATGHVRRPVRDRRVLCWTRVVSYAHYGLPKQPHQLIFYCTSSFYHILTHISSNIQLYCLHEFDRKLILDKTHSELRCRCTGVRIRPPTGVERESRTNPPVSRESLRVPYVSRRGKPPYVRLAVLVPP